MKTVKISLIVLSSFVWFIQCKIRSEYRRVMRVSTILLIKMWPVHLCQLRVFAMLMTDGGAFDSGHVVWK